MWNGKRETEVGYRRTLTDIVESYGRAQLRRTGERYGY